MSEQTPTVSFVVPALDEAAYLPESLDAIESQHTDVPYELVVVVDERSTDGTHEIAVEFARTATIPVEVVETSGGYGPGFSRNVGAERARGDWLTFIDADTVVRDDYVQKMVTFVRENDLVAASSNCRLYGNPGWRERFVEWGMNNACLKPKRPLLPGFNIFTRADAFEKVGRFPDIPSEDTHFSRVIVDEGRTDVLRKPLVSTSSRRLAKLGLLGYAFYYAKSNWTRLRAIYRNDRKPPDSPHSEPEGR